jgi:predicted transcriptional regulator
MSILRVLWEHGPGSVKEVHRALLRDERIDKELHYNTVQTMLRLMEDKGLVEHHVDGRTFIYTAIYSRDESARSYVDRVFDGAASELVLSLLRAESIPADELERMHNMIAGARRERKEGRT